MDCSTPGFPILYYFPEFPQTHVHWVDDAIYNFTVILSFVAFFSSCLQSFPASGSFPSSRFFTSDGQNIGASASASVLSMNIQGLFPSGLTGLIFLLSKGLSRAFSSITIEGIDSLALCLLYGPALTIIRDHWEDYSLSSMDFWWQSNISAFQHTI